MRKELGKIDSAEFGFGGYQDVMLGISFTFKGSGWGVSHFDGDWSIERSQNAKWTEEDRLRRLGETVMRLGKLLVQAKVNNVTQLVGIPVECEFDGNMLKSWRILEEVL